MFARLSIATGIFATLLVGLLVMAPSDALAACAPSTSPYIVTLYKHDDCGGTPLVLDSDTPNLTQTVPVLNDASALVIGKNVSVTLYEDANYGKKNICWNGPAQINKLDAFPISPGNGWGDDPSSVKVGAAGACTNPAVTSVGCVSSAASGSVTLYEDDDCGGTSLGLNTNTTDLSKMKPPFNNASSLVVGDNATVFLYEHKDYEGSRICWNGPYTANKLDDFEFVGGSNWNDVPSSVTFGGECANPGKTVQVDDGCETGISGVFCRLGTVVNIVKNLPVVIPTAVIVITVTLTASLASVLASAVEFFFIWFAKEAINIPVTSENPFVEQGFHISLTIVNSLFVLILVIIGLATILRFQRYQFQKLLPTFFVVALLINFSGVFVGFIVDMGNILTNIFLSRIASFGTVAQQVGSLGGDLLSYVSSPGFDELYGNLVGIVAKSVILLLYNAVLLIVLFILLLIFVIRASILSLLAVLSPFAFAAYILPATRGFFEQWWKQLIQWSLIGAPIAFFLYLSNLFLTTGGGFPKGGLEGAGALGEVIYGIITPLASLILLIAGIGISIQLAPAGAQGAINFGKKWGAAAGALAGKRAWQYTRDRVPHDTRETFRKASASASPEWGKGRAGLGGWVLRGAAGAYGYSKRATGKGFTTVVSGSEQADIERTRTAAMKRDVSGNLSALRQAGSVTEKTAILDAMRQKDQIRDAGNPDLVGGKQNVLKQEEITSIYEKARQTRNTDLVEGLQRAFVNNAGAIKEFARITDEFTKSFEKAADQTQGGLDRRDREERGYASLTEKVVGEARTADEIKALQKGWHEEEKNIEAVNKFWGGSQTSQAATAIGRDFVNRLEKGKKPEDWYFELTERKDEAGNAWRAPRNAAMPRYLASSAAQGLGLSPVEGLETTNAVTQRANVANILASQPLDTRTSPSRPLLENQYKILQAVAMTRLTLEREKQRGATPAMLKRLQDEIDVRLKDIRDGVDAAAGLPGVNQDKLENDWSRIQEIMRTRQRRRREEREEDEEEREEYRGG
ncbi:MAG: hypothetical protein A2842_00805 [Candidatus Wildermuthbacteria bacterium RIFCSPHIGHO2_01_FULL_48_25]|uniref:TrbL/VirB6 plasmid conjugal transfer protein n=1 Tax=Candidatus Wildermuthbacteria bacterium RIFCSPLOWO2_01_FULL_48_16 TaxID=1802461 RepID=A0A1G2RLD5_9BACT|nr:MAG: hypothetical protein A2842_00805 [Candidatus Wildermuthbacteria bacterium RIFCSPHIGHO2_01_FULL_48_25]OHA73092.1 MAG: hypothetical protein A3B24_01615 [Candidatus Wildermuthbacteria bacterium RIFCSPLOWO2_01_FULL_48_16]